MKYYFLILTLLFQSACYSSAQQIKVERKPFQKSSVAMKSPTSYLKRETDKGEYDPKPRVVLVDEKAGKYELRWIGYDGKEKIIKYQRADAIDALVEARVEKNSEGKFVFKYLVKNLPTSPAYLSGFIVQTLANDVKVNKLEDVHIGEMSNSLRDFKEGIWRHFAPLGETSSRIEAGKSIEFSLVSSALPGIVGCRATAGELTLKGVGEHMPSELEAAMPGYEELAKGYTIGPIDHLATLNKSERTKYILENLPKFQEAGWITSDGVKRYEAVLKRENLAGAFEQAKKDLENQFITSEVYYIIEGLNQ